MVVKSRRVFAVIFILLLILLLLLFLLYRAGKLLFVGTTESSGAGSEAKTCEEYTPSLEQGSQLEGLKFYFKCGESDMFVIYAIDKLSNYPPNGLQMNSAKYKQAFSTDSEDRNYCASLPDAYTQCSAAFYSEDLAGEELPFTLAADEVYFRFGGTFTEDMKLANVKSFVVYPFSFYDYEEESDGSQVSVSDQQDAPSKYDPYRQVNLEW